MTPRCLKFISFWLAWQILPWCSIYKGKEGWSIYFLFLWLLQIVHKSKPRINLYRQAKTLSHYSSHWNYFWTISPRKRNMNRKCELEGQKWFIMHVSSAISLIYILNWYAYVTPCQAKKTDWISRLTGILFGDHLSLFFRYLNKKSWNCSTHKVYSEMLFSLHYYRSEGMKAIPTFRIVLL